MKGSARSLAYQRRDSNYTIHDVTMADVAQIRMCDCGGHHQVDEKGIGTDGRHLTTCPKHRTYDAEFAAAIKSFEQCGTPARRSRPFSLVPRR